MSDKTAVPRVNQRAAQQQATRVLDSLSRLRPGAAALLTVDPLGELSTWHEIEVRFVPVVEADAGCSVAGAYLAGATPPVLAVAETVSHGRRAFTALHELAHHLQQSDYTLMAALLDQPDGGHGLEDAACDAFAAEVLLPTQLADQYLAEGVTASAINTLWQASRASRAAACVRAAQRLTTPGQIILLDETGTVQFVTAHGLPPVRRGSSQAGIPVVREALRSTSRRGRGRTQLAYRDGIRGQELYAQASDIGGFLVLVVVTDHAPWETTFSLPARDDGPQGRDWICEHCDHEFTAYNRPCDRCGIPACPECHRCNCTPRVAERECSLCHLVQPLRMYDGSSARCLDCS